MAEVAFCTPGKIPMDAFTIMGVNVKVSDNPIGRFGTGLKYAVAVILRHGGSIQLFIGGVEYEFYIHKRDFRGEEIKQIRMRKKDGLGKWLSSRALPFTTQLGRNWELWQAYRELESNTRDESGWTMVAEEGSHVQLTDDAGTMFVIDCPGFVEQVKEAKVFLDPSQLHLAYKNPMLEAYSEPSQYLYYRGIRVYTLRYKSRLTYNFTNGVDLTEDRTLSYPYYMYSVIAQALMSCDDRKLLRRVLAKPETHEGPRFETNDLQLNSEAKANDTFRSVAASLTAEGRGGEIGLDLRCDAAPRASVDCLH